MLSLSMDAISYLTEGPDGHTFFLLALMFIRALYGNN